MGHGGCIFVVFGPATQCRPRSKPFDLLRFQRAKKLLQPIQAEEPVKTGLHERGLSAQAGESPYFQSIREEFFPSLLLVG